MFDLNKRLIKKSTQSFFSLEYIPLVVRELRKEKNVLFYLRLAIRRLRSVYLRSKRWLRWKLVRAPLNR